MVWGLAANGLGLGRRDAASGLIIGMTGGILWPIGSISILTKFPRPRDPPSIACRV